MNNSQSSLLNLASLVQDSEYPSQEAGDVAAANSANNNSAEQPSNTGSNFSNTPRAMQGLSLPQLSYSEKEAAGKNATGNRKDGSSSSSASASISSAGSSSNNRMDAGKPLDQENVSRNDAVGGHTESARNEAGQMPSESQTEISDNNDTTGRNTLGFMQYPKSTMSGNSLQRMNVAVPGIDMPLVSGETTPQLSNMNMNMMGLVNSQTMGKMGGSSFMNANSESSTGGMTPTTNGPNVSVGVSSNNALLGMQMPMMLNSGSGSNTGVNPNTAQNIMQQSSNKSKPANASLSDANANGSNGLNTGNDDNMIAGSASQRMLNMKSDLSDLPMNTHTAGRDQRTDAASVLQDAENSSQTSNANSNALLQNANPMGTSSLPAITIINDGEHVNPVGELIGKSGKPLTNTKRAAQNRNAQRAFRQRREKYIKDLEFKARDYNRLMAELESFKNENRMLKAQLGQFQQRLNL